MLYRCQIVALVGGGPVPKWPPSKVGAAGGAGRAARDPLLAPCYGHESAPERGRLPNRRRRAAPQVMIWDDAQGRCIGELNFRTPARAVRLRRERICVALEHKVLVYNFSDLRLTHSIETASNAGGLLALSTLIDHAVLACPGQHAGQVKRPPGCCPAPEASRLPGSHSRLPGRRGQRVHSAQRRSRRAGRSCSSLWPQVRVEAFDSGRTKFIQAHNSPLAALALSGSGRVLATASAKGTLIRTWSAADGTRLQELRRGADPARVYCLAFSR